MADKWAQYVEQAPTNKWDQYAEQQAPNAGLSQGNNLPNIQMNPVADPIGAARSFGKQMLNFNPVTVGKNLIGAGGLQPPVDPNQQPMSLREIAKNASLSNIIKNTGQEASGLAPGDTTSEKVGAGSANALAAILTGKAALREPTASLADTPIGKKIPNAARASQAFTDVEKVAGPLPVDVNPAGNVALRIQSLAESGGSMPKVVRDFMKRVTDPEKGDLSYSEARQFYSNASRLSADEFQRLTPVMQFQVGQFTRALGQSIQDTATTAGQGAKYSGAMNEFRNAMRMKAIGRNVGEAAIKYVPYAAGAYAVKKLSEK